MDIKKIKPVIKKYLNKIKKDMPIEQVILFGSYAHGTAKKDSDIDLIILSKKFAKMDEDKRLRFLYRRAVGFPYNLHAYGFTPKEFESASRLTTLAEIKKTGTIIF